MIICIRLQHMLLVVCAALAVGGWVDPDTDEADVSTSSLVDGSKQRLVFSDEFNTDGRKFIDGMDPRWTAINKDDYTNNALTSDLDTISRNNLYIPNAFLYNIHPFQSSCQNEQR